MIPEVMLDPNAGTGELYLYLSTPHSHPRSSHINQIIIKIKSNHIHVPTFLSADKDKDKDKESDDAKGEASEAGAAPSTGGTGSGAKNAAKEKEKQEKNADGSVKANKGMILRKSVDYIRYLQQLVGAQAARNRALERKLNQAGISSDTVPGDDMLESPLNELELGIGMGISIDGPFLGLGGSGAGAAAALQAFGGENALHALEPMPMDEDMDMDMDFDTTMVNGFHHDHHGQGKASEMNGVEHSASSHSQDEHGEGGDRDGGLEGAASPTGTGTSDASASSPHALSLSQDHTHSMSIGDRERDRSADASVSDDWDPLANSTSSLNSSTTGMSEKEKDSSLNMGSSLRDKERGRRGRPPAAPSEGAAGSVGARVGRRRSKLVSVKEEGVGMEV